MKAPHGTVRYNSNINGALYNWATLVAYDETVYDAIFDILIESFSLSANNFSCRYTLS